MLTGERPATPTAASTTRRWWRSATPSRTSMGGGRVRPRHRHGRDPRRAPVRAPRRRPAGLGKVGYGTTRTQAASAFGRLGVDVAYVDTTDSTPSRRRSRHADPRASPRDHRQPDLRRRGHPRPRGGRASPRGHADRRQHLRLAVGVPAARAGGRPRGGIRDQVPVRPLGRDCRRRGRLGRPHRPGPSARSRPAPRSPHSPRSSCSAGSRRSRSGSSARRALPQALATYLEGRDGVAGVIYPGLPSHPQRAVASAILDSGGAMLSVDLAGGREAGARPSSTPCGSRSGPPASAACTRWSCTRPRRRTGPSMRRRSRRRASSRSCHGCPSGWRTRRTSWPTSGRRSRRPARRARPRSPPRRRAAIATIAARRPAARPAQGLPTRPRERHLGPADLGRLRRDPDQRARVHGRDRHDVAPAAELRLPLADRLQQRDGPAPRHLRRHARDGRRQRARAAELFRCSAPCGSASGSSC